MADEKKKNVKKTKKDNKVYNNSYLKGDKLKGDDYQLNNALKVSDDYASSYLGSVYKPDETSNNQRLKDEVIRLIDVNEELKSLLQDQKKKKFNKINVNFIFKLIYNHLYNDQEFSIFMDIIQVFDIVSNLTGLKYKNLFDLLDIEYKELVISELDQTHDILTNYKNFNKMY